MYTQKEVRYAVKEEIAYITLDRPDTRNAIEPVSLRELSKCFDMTEHDSAVKAIILTGGGTKSFISGADITVLQAWEMEDQFYRNYSLKLINQIENHPKPVIAAINGAAFGGGFEIAMACDFRIAAAHAKFGLPEVSLGIMPGMGGTQRLSRLIGIARAKEVILAGRVLTASEARDLGIVTEVSEQNDLLATAEALARKILRGAPMALTLAKRAINHSLDTDIETGTKLEQSGFMALLTTTDKREGVQAFLEKRPPMFIGK